MAGSSGPFLNQRAFDDPQNWMRAEGVDTDPGKAFVSTNGKALFYARTGGMMKPERCELVPGDTLYRLGASGAEVPQLMAGSWWVAKAEFSKLLSFAQQQGLGVGMAVRALCLVPPQWSDMGQLIRVSVRRPLLAMRGLGQSVSVDAADGLGRVEMQHQNHNPARRLHHLFIPGLREPGLADSALSFGNVFALDPKEGMRGWIYS